MLKLSQLCLAGALLLAHAYASAQVAGKVLFKSGDAVITHADQSTAQIAQHDPINSGDTIETRLGRVQLSYHDGAKVSLQPHTIYKIQQYAFSGAEDGSEHAITELIKGGLRTVTGLIGHKNRERYQLRTPVATIGIRGTEFTVLYLDKLMLTTNAGSVDVCNAAGCRNAKAGQSITAEDSNRMPQYTSEVAQLAVAVPSVNKPVFVPAEILNENRLSAVVVDSALRAGLPMAAIDDNNVTPDSPVEQSASTISGTDILVTAVGRAANQYYHLALLNGSAGNNSNNNLARFESGGTEIKLISANRGDYFSDAFVAMGRGKGSINNNNLETLSYITGEATSAAGLMQLANSNLQYNVLASTAPVLTANGSTLAVGNPNSVTGQLLVNFASLLYSYNLNVPLGNLIYHLAGANSLTAGTANFASNATISTNLGNVGCLAGCTGVLLNADGSTSSLVGRLIGENAERAGIQYGFSTNIHLNGAANNSELTGSIILQK